VVGFEQSIFIWEWSVVIYTTIHYKVSLCGRRRGMTRGTVEKGEGMNWSSDGRHQEKALLGLLVSCTVCHRDCLLLVVLMQGVPKMKQWSKWPKGEFSLTAAEHRGATPRTLPTVLLIILSLIQVPPSTTSYFWRGANVQKLMTELVSCLYAPVTLVCMRYCS